MNNYLPKMPKWEALLGTILVNNTMVSHIWIIGIFILAIILLAYFKAPVWLLVGLILILAWMVLVYTTTYIFFMFKNPKMLLSEKTLLSFHRMENLGKKDKEMPYELMQRQQSVEGQIIHETKRKKLK